MRTVRLVLVGVLTTVVLPGCGGGERCGDTFLMAEVFGGGSVSITLESPEEPGVTGSGTAEGWDAQLYRGDEESPGPPQPGGQLVVYEHTDDGYACVALDRTDLTDCPATAACVHWHPDSTGTLADTTLYDAVGNTVVDGRATVASISRASTASGTLTVDALGWNGVCWTGGLGVTWAFDESDPFEDYGTYICG